MSILSKFLKTKLNVPEVNFKDIPIAETFLSQLIHSGGQKILAPLKDFDLHFLKVLIDGELNRRNPNRNKNNAFIEVKTTRAGIGGNEKFDQLDY